MLHSACNYFVQGLEFCCAGAAIVLHRRAYGFAGLAINFIKIVTRWVWNLFFLHHVQDAAAGIRTNIARVSIFTDALLCYTERLTVPVFFFFRSGGRDSEPQSTPELR